MKETRSCFQQVKIEEGVSAFSSIVSMDETSCVAIIHTPALGDLPPGRVVLSNSRVAGDLERIVGRARELLEGHERALALKDAARAL